MIIIEEELKKVIYNTQSITKRLIEFIEDAELNINLKSWEAWSEFQRVYYKEIIEQNKPTILWKKRVKSFNLGNIGDTFNDR